MTQLASSSLLLSNEINVFWRSDGEFAPSLVSEISRTGAFIKTPKPAPVGTSLQLRIDAPGREICAQAVVRRVVPGQGMAVEFEADHGGRPRAFATPWSSEFEVAHASPVGPLCGSSCSRSPLSSTPFCANSKPVERKPPAAAIRAIAASTVVPASATNSLPPCN